MVDRWEGQNFLKTCLRGDEKIVFLLRGVKKFLNCLGKTFYIKCRGVKFFSFYTWGGQQIFCSSERGVQNFCHVILNSTTPLLLSYKWPPPKARPGNALETRVREKSSMPTAIWWLPNRHELRSKESWSRGAYAVFGPICPPPLPMLSPSSNSHSTN